LTRIKIVSITGFLLFIIYLFLLITEWIYGYLGNYKDIVFSCILAIISLSLMFKGLLIKSVSTIWFSLCLIIYALCIIVFNIIDFNYLNYYSIFALIPVISSLIILVIFKNLLYIRLIIINIFIALPIFFLNIFDFNVWIFVTILIFSIILSVFVCRLIRFNKEKL